MLNNDPPTMTGAPPPANGTTWQEVAETSAKAQSDGDGAAVPATPAATETAPPPTPAPSDGAPARRPALRDDVLTVLLAATSPLTLDEIQADVNVTGPFTPLQFIEDEIEGLIKVHRVAFTFEGSVKRYVLTATARSEIDKPGIVLDEREKIILAMASVTLSSEVLHYDAVEGIGPYVAQVGNGASAEELAAEIDAESDTSTAEPSAEVIDHVEQHALALMRAGVFAVRDYTPESVGVSDAEDEEEDEDPPSSHGDTNFEDEDETDEPESASEGMNGSSTPAAPPVKVFTFAPGMVDTLFRVGARALAQRSLPEKEAPPSLPSAEEEAARVYGTFETKLKAERLRTAEMEAERDRYKTDLAMLTSKWRRAAKWLDENGGGTDLDAIAAEPKPKPDPRVFAWTRRVPVTPEVKSEILDELNALDTQLEEIGKAEEVSKTSIKERKAKVQAKITDLKSASRAVEFVYAKDAYREPDWRRKVIVVKSAEAHDYGRVLDEEPIPHGMQAPLFTGTQPSPPDPRPPAVDPIITTVLGGEPAPDFTPAPTPEATPETSAAQAAQAEPATPADPNPPAFVKKAPGEPDEPEGATDKGAESDAPADKPVAPIAFELTTASLREKITALYQAHPAGITERDEPLKFVAMHAPDRASLPGSVITFMSRVSAMMLKDGTLSEAADGTAENGKLRWLATQIDPRRLSAAELAALEAEAKKKLAPAGSTPAGDAAPPVKRKPGRPPGSKNKPKDPNAPPKPPKASKGGKGAAKK